MWGGRGRRVEKGHSEPAADRWFPGTLREFVEMQVPWYPPIPGIV